MATAEAISVLSLSQNRAVARLMHQRISPHGYAIGGVLESDPFSVPDLGLALRVLEPPPRAIVVGRGYTEDEANHVRATFAEYSKAVGLESGTVIKITDKVFDEVSKEGIPSWVLQQLQDYFEK